MAASGEAGISAVAPVGREPASARGGDVARGPSTVREGRHAQRAARIDLRPAQQAHEAGAPSGHQPRRDARRSSVGPDTRAGRPARRRWRTRNDGRSAGRWRPARRAAARSTRRSPCRRTHRRPPRAPPWHPAGRGRRAGKQQRVRSCVCCAAAMRGPKRCVAFRPLRARQKSARRRDRARHVGGAASAVLRGPMLLTGRGATRRALSTGDRLLAGPAPTSRRLAPPPQPVLLLLHPLPCTWCSRWPRRLHSISAGLRSIASPSCHRSAAAHQSVPDERDAFAWPPPVQPTGRTFRRLSAMAGCTSSTAASTHAPPRAPSAGSSSSAGTIDCPADRASADRGAGAALCARTDLQKGARGRQCRQEHVVRDQRGRAAGGTPQQQQRVQR